MPDDAVDFAAVAYREEGQWRLEELDDDALEDLDTLIDELQRWPGEFGALGLVSVDDEFFLVVRVAGEDVRLLLSDVTAATEWPLAREVVDELEIPVTDDDDDPTPAGDVDIVEDLGLSAMDMAALLDDFDLYPDELLGDIAHKLGFGRLYDQFVGVPTP